MNSCADVDAVRGWSVTTAAGTTAPCRAEVQKVMLLACLALKAISVLLDVVIGLFYTFLHQRDPISNSYCNLVYHVCTHYRGNTVPLLLQLRWSGYVGCCRAWTLSSGTDTVKIKMSKTDLNVELEMAGTSVGTCWKPEVYTGKSTVED